ncbi:hypothetical protein ACS0TY_001968 [Phlomoides rotata]
MEVDHVDAEGEEREASTSRRNYREKSHYPGAVRRKAYIFDGDGNYYNKEWDLSEGRGKEFCWYHVELPRENKKLSQSAQYLIDVLCPPLKLQDILSLNSVITVSLGRVPRLGFSPANESLLSEIPVVEGSINGNGGEEGRAGMVIKEHVLDFLLTMNHWEEADNPVPRSVSNLVVHIIDSHMGHLEDVMTKLELELDSVEVELDRGCFALKKQWLDDRKFPKMHLNLQRLLQVIAYGEQVFPKVKEKCSSKHWFANEDINALEELIARIRRLKENVWKH